MKQIIVDNQITNYYITEDGKCFNDKTGKYLKGQISNSGYLNYNLSFNNQKKRIYAHRLVAQAYIPNPENKKEVNHIDGNKLNNCVENLEWNTSTENQIHRYYNLNKGVMTQVYQFDKNKKLIKIYPSINQASRENNIAVSGIMQEIHKNKKTLVKGYYWSDNENNSFDIIIRKNTGKAKVVCQYDLQGNKLNTFSSTGEAARAIGGNGSHIGECCRGKIKTYKGYKWSYLL